MRDLMPPLFYLATGLSFLLFLAVNLLARQVFRSLYGRLLGFAMLAMAAGFLLFASATQADTLGGASSLIVAGGGASFLSLLLVAAGVAALSRRERATP